MDSIQMDALNVNSDRHHAQSRTKPLSATNLARFHNYDCEKFIYNLYHCVEKARFTGTVPASLSGELLVNTQPDVDENFDTTSPYLEALFARGEQHETNLFCRLLDATPSCSPRDMMELSNESANQEKNVDWIGLYRTREPFDWSSLKSYLAPAADISNTATASSHFRQAFKGVYEAPKGTVLYLVDIVLYPPQNLFKQEFTEFLKPFISKYPKLKDLQFELSIIKPDLVKLEKKAENNQEFVEWTVIDAKSSHTVKEYHIIQIAWYRFCLQKMLPSILDSVADVVKDSGLGGVWLPENHASSTEANLFDISIWDKLHKEFFFQKVPLALISDNPSWHYSTKCRGCEWEKDCQTLAEQEQHFSLLGIPPKGLREMVKKFVNIQGPHIKITDIEDLMNNTTFSQQEPQTFEKLKKQLRYEKQESLAIKAAKEGRFQIDQKACGFLYKHPVRTPKPLPKSEKGKGKSKEPNFPVRDVKVVNVFLKLLVDPLTEQMYYWQIGVDLGAGHHIWHDVENLQGFLQVLESEPCLVLVEDCVNRILDQNMEWYRSAKALVGFLSCILDYMDNIDSDVYCKYLQFYCWNGMEETTLLNLLRRLASEGDTVDIELEKCLLYFGHFDGTSFKNPVQSTNVELEHVLPRIISLQDAARDLYVIPGFDGYTCYNVCKSLLTDPKGKDYVEQLRATEDASVFTHYVRSDNGKVDKHVTALESLLPTYRYLLQEFRRDPERLCHKPAEFSMPTRLELKHKVLEKLYFMTNLESWADLDQTRRQRWNTDRHVILNNAQNSPNPSESKQFNKIFRVVSGNEFVEVTDSTLGSKWLIADNKWTKNTHLTINDLGSSWSAGFRNVWVADVCDYDGTSVELSIRVKSSNYTDREPVPHTSYRLVDRYLDINSPKTIKTLQSISSNFDNSPVRDIICSDPAVDWNDVLFSEEQKSKLVNRIPQVQVKTGFNLKNITDEVSYLWKRRVTTIWGPPGTGKTTLLARMCAVLLSLHDPGDIEQVSNDETVLLSPSGESLSKPIKILYVACTHGALTSFIETFHKVRLELSKAREFKMFYEKQDRVVRSGLLPKTVLYESKGKDDDWDKHHGIFINTAWSAHNLGKYNRQFDVVIIDEGSQMPVAQACIAIDRLKSLGRLVVAGDHCQLAPILRVKYPKGHDYEHFQGSILDCVRRRFPHSVHQLKDSYRIPPVVARSSSVVYSKDYKSQKIGKPLMKIVYECNAVSKLLDQEDVLGENKGFILLAIDFGDATSYDAYLSREQDVVRQICEAVVVQETRSVFIVTPHRAQRSLCQRIVPQSWKDAQDVAEAKFRYRLDTVEKMQGDEARLVVGCYASPFWFYTEHGTASDQEMDFFFDYTRLNVTTTRAQDLCVLLVDKKMMDYGPPYKALTNPKRAQMWNLLMEYKKHATLCDYPIAVPTVTNLTQHVQSPLPVFEPDRVEIQDVDQAILPEEVHANLVEYAQPIEDEFEDLPSGMMEFLSQENVVPDVQAFAESPQSRCVSPAICSEVNDSMEEDLEPAQVENPQVENPQVKLGTPQPFSSQDSTPVHHISLTIHREPNRASTSDEEEPVTSTTAKTNEEPTKIDSGETNLSLDPLEISQVEGKPKKIFNATPFADAGKRGGVKAVFNEHTPEPSPEPLQSQLPISSSQPLPSQESRHSQPQGSSSQLNLPNCQPILSQASTVSTIQGIIDNYARERTPLSPPRTVSPQPSQAGPIALPHEFTNNVSASPICTRCKRACYYIESTLSLVCDSCRISMPILIPLPLTRPGKRTNADAFPVSPQAAPERGNPFNFVDSSLLNRENSMRHIPQHNSLNFQHGPPGGVDTNLE